MHVPTKVAVIKGRVRMHVPPTVLDMLDMLMAVGAPISWFALTLLLGANLLRLN